MLPDYPDDNKIEKISIYKESYSILILLALVFTIFDFFVFLGYPNFQILAILNFCKIFILCALHPFFKRKSVTIKEEEQIRISIGILFSIPINVFFALSLFDFAVNMDFLLLKKMEYYTFQFCIFLLTGILVLRFHFKLSLILNSGLVFFYICLIFSIKTFYYGMESDLFFLMQAIVLVFFAIAPICINYYLDKFSLNQKRLEDQTFFWRQYSESLLKKTLPKTYYFQNICLLYFDISGIANYFRTNSSLNSLDPFLKMLFLDIDEFCKQNKIELHQEEGKYWFLTSELPASTNEEYADPIADLALLMQTRFKRICAENRLQFDLRMGISIGKYIEYQTNAQKLDIFYLNKPFQDASLMEKFGINGEIQVSDETFQLLKTRFQFIKRGSMNIQTNKEVFQDFYLLVART